MTHADVLAHDAVDRYVRGALDPDERAAFEEHYFSCGECFANVQAADALRSAVRAAAEQGDLPPLDGRAPGGVRWLLPYAASVVLAAGLGWSMFIERPALQSRLDSVAAERDVLSARPPAPIWASTPPRVEANVPIAFLEAERGTAASARVVIPAGGSQLVVAISAPAVESARLEVRKDGSGLAAAVDGLRRNATGAYVAVVPADRLPDGSYRLRLLAQDVRGSRLIGEYILAVSRRP